MAPAHRAASETAPGSPRAHSAGVPVDDSGSGHVVDLKAIGAWLADELDGELYRIEHDL
jgi:hypothetical protein